MADSSKGHELLHQTGLCSTPTVGLSERKIQDDLRQTINTEEIMGKSTKLTCYSLQVKGIE